MSLTRLTAQRRSCPGARRVSPLRIGLLRVGLLRRGVTGVLLAASVLCSRSQPAAAESDPERAFREGRALLVEGRFAEACAKLEHSQRLEARLGTQLNVAFCHERQGKVASAWSGFRGAVSTARREGDGARQEFAQSRADALEPRVPWLRVQLAAGADAQQLRILLDGAPLAPASWQAEQPLDPGQHELIASFAGQEYWRTALELREAQHAAVTIPAPPAPPLSDPPPASAAPRAAGRFVYELGAFLGYIDVDTQRVTPDDSPPRLQATVQDEDGRSQAVSCATNSCEYDLFGTSSGFVVGLEGFAGYTLAPHVDLGLRFLLGPRASGGVLVALGPSASFVLGERYRVSPTVFFGHASHSAQGSAELTAGNSTYYIDTRVSASLGFAIGLGSELGFTLTRSQAGSVVLQATPLFLYGANGLAWSVPLGAAYHWN